MSVCTECNEKKAKYECPFCKNGLCVECADLMEMQCDYCAPRLEPIFTKKKKKL